MLNIGDKAPDFCLLDDQSNKHTLKNFHGKKIVIYFYPKDLTPGCTLESCSFRDKQPIFADKNTVILGVSRDSIEKHQKFKQKHALSFPLLADVEGKMCEAYGVLKQKSMFGKKYMGIERSTFLIDEKGIIQKIWRKVGVIGHVQEVLESI